MLYFHCGLIASVLAIGGCLHSVALGQDVLAELEKNTAMDFKGVPLKDIALYLQEQHQVNFRLEPGVQVDLTITYKTDGVSLRTALTGMLSPRKLAFAVRDKTIWIVPAPETE